MCSVCLSVFSNPTKQLQAPRNSRQSLVKGRSHANAVAQQALIAHWQSIVKSLNNYLMIMKANFVSSKFHIKCLFPFLSKHDHNLTMSGLIGSPFLSP